MDVVPYIGITDFTTAEQVRAMLEVVKSGRRVGSSRELHVGAMMSHHTLHGIPEDRTKYYPQKEMISKIFYDFNNYNCIHYVDYRRWSEELWRDLLEVIRHGGIGIRALQLDMLWPDPSEIHKAVHASRKQIDVILQVGTYALQDIASVEELVTRLEEYEPVINRVLLDQSMGKGVSMNPDYLLPFLRAISKRFPNLGLVVAGGLGPDTMDLVIPIAREFPNVSVDAQGKLRPSGNWTDPVDWEMAKAYLNRALQVLE